MMELSFYNNGHKETYKNPLIDEILEVDLCKGAIVYSPVFGELCYDGKDGRFLYFVRVYNKDRVKFRFLQKINVMWKHGKKYKVNIPRV